MGVDLHKLELRKPDGRALTLYGRSPFPGDIVAPIPGEGSRPSSHLRWHPLRGEWVVYAGHRQTRTFLPPVELDPLAPTRSPERPTELPEGPWDVAVFDNRFPAFSADYGPPPALGVPTRAALGACEVCVFSQDGQGSFGELPLWHIEMILAVWAERTRILGERPDVAYVFPFENRGQEIGVTLHHPHGQIYAYPFVPPIIARELELGRRHLADHGSGLLESLLAREVSDGRRVVWRSEHVACVVPVCARYAYELWIAPLRPVATLPELGDAERAELAAGLRDALRRLDAVFERPMPYILAVHQGPSDGQAHPEAHLHLEIYPYMRSAGRLKYLAGSEIGAGVFTADTLPEERAAELRALRIDHA